MISYEPFWTTIEEKASTRKISLRHLPEIV